MVTPLPPDIRRLFPATADAVLLDNASEGPLALPVAQAMEAFVAELALTPVQLRAPAALSHTALARVGALLGVPAGGLSWVHSTTSGLVALARGLPLDAGSVVAIPENEYPAVVVPWLERTARRGDVRVELLPVAPAVAGGTAMEVLRAAVSRPEVKVLSLSAVGWLGHRYPLGEIAELCHRHGVLFAVDGSQATGMVRLSLADARIDFYVSTLAKWAFGPEGIGCLYLSDEVRERLRPTIVSIESLALDQDRLLDFGLPFPAAPAPMIMAYPAPILVAGARAGVDLLLELGQAAVEQHVLEMSGRLHELLAELGYEVRSDPRPEHRSGIVTFSHAAPERNRAIAAGLRERGIYLRLRESLLRASVHAYTVPGDLQRLAAALIELGR